MEHGRGVYVSANGDRYEGEYRDGMEHGRGVYVWANGDRYEGEYIRSLARSIDTPYTKMWGHLASSPISGILFANMKQRPRK